MIRRFIRFEDLEAKGIPLSRSQIMRKVKDGRFPKPVKFGKERVAWIESELDEWINQRIADRHLKRNRVA